MESELSDGSLQAWRALLTAQAVVLDGVEGQLQAAGQLPLTWFEVLARLSNADGGMLRMQDLADRLVLSRSGVTRLVDRIEAAGLIERASCSSDRRGTFAVVTGAGRQAFEAARPFVDRAVQEQFGRYLNESETGALGLILRKLLDGHGYALARPDDCGPVDVAQTELAAAEPS